MVKALIHKSRGTAKAVGNAYREVFSGLPREIWYLALSMFINRSGSMVLPFLALYLNKELGYSQEVAVTMVAVFGVGSIIGSFGGWYAIERWEPIRVQIVALIVNAIGFALLSQMPNYFWFAFVLLPTSIVSEAFRPANLAAITLLSPPELHKRAFALNRLAINLGFGIGPSVAGILAPFSYQWLFWLDAVTCFAAAAAMYLLLYRNHADLRRRIAPNRLRVRQNPFRDAPFMAFVLLTIVTFAVFFQLMSTYPLFLSDEYGLGETSIGILLALNPLIVVACEMILVHRIHRWNQMRTIAWGSFLMCAAFGILPFGRGFAYAAFGVLVLTVGEMLMMPQAMTHVAARSDEQSRGRYVGFYTTGVSIAFVLGPLIGSFCYRISHTLFPYVSLAIGVIVLIGFYLVERMESSQGETQAKVTTDEDAFLSAGELETAESKL